MKHIAILSAILLGSVVMINPVRATTDVDKNYHKKSYSDIGTLVSESQNVIRKFSTTMPFAQQPNLKKIRIGDYRSTACGTGNHPSEVISCA